MPNFLEQLVAEWYEFNGYFVRRNIRVGRRARGGFDTELDVVAFHPVEKRLVHIEPSMDADQWNKRETRYRRKFEAGKKHIPELFKGFAPLPEIEQFALFVFNTVARSEVGGGKVLSIQKVMDEVRASLSGLSVARSAIPEQFVILRSLQFSAEYWK